MYDAVFAQDVAAAWQVDTQAPRVTSPGSGRIFEIRLTPRLSARLKFYPKAQAERVAARARWQEALADTGFACPWPQRTRSGDLVVHLKQAPSVAVMEQAIHGHPVQIPENRDAALATYGDLAALLADFHLSAESIDPLPFPARSNPDRNFDPNAAIAHFESKGQTEIAELLSRLSGALTKSCDESRVCLGKLELSETLEADHTLYLTDMDTAGTGDRLRDLSRLLTLEKDPDRLESVFEAICRSYESGGILLKESDKAAILYGVISECVEIFQPGACDTTLDNSTPGARILAASALLSKL
ncbi:phosphotransferase [Fluviibacterium sp. DFM31]|uniref:Phosphotransferase n=1 Tax=Meridianimarinicoccus marinus TaxID=3231483 RepID=A0ABV3L3F9_9RHOB